MPNLVHRASSALALVTPAQLISTRPGTDPCRMAKVTDRGDHTLTELLVTEPLVTNQELDGRDVPDLGQRATG